MQCLVDGVIDTAFEPSLLCFERGYQTGIQMLEELSQRKVSVLEQYSLEGVIQAPGELVLDDQRLRNA